MFNTDSPLEQRKEECKDQHSIQESITPNREAPYGKVKKNTQEMKKVNKQCLLDTLAL